jgi:2'-5' RNA ligase
MYSIWAEPVEKDAKYLSRIIDSLGKKYDSPTFCPHITLYGKIRNESVAKSAIDICRMMKKFAVKTTDLAFSDYLWKTVFINAEKSQKILYVHDAIRKAVPQHPKYEFNPHISLIYKKLDDCEKQAIIDSLKVKQRFTFDKITVIASSNDVKKWKVLDRVVLK